MLMSIAAPITSASRRPPYEAARVPTQRFLNAPPRAEEIVFTSNSTLPSTSSPTATGAG
jgi:hypothetical protein